MARGGRDVCPEFEQDAHHLTRALDFVLMNLLENGDEIVAMRVFDDEQRA